MERSTEVPAVPNMEVAIKRSLLTRNKLAIIVKGPKGVAQYCCVECPVRCLNIKKLEVHLLTHFKEYRYLCGICGTGLKRKEHLDRHTQEHQQVRPHICQECGKGFKRKEHLSIHMTIHTGDKNQTCTLCNKAFYRKDHLQKHQQTHSKLFVEENMHLLGDQETIDIKQEVVDDDEDYGIVMENNEAMDASSTEPQFSDTNYERPYACTVCGKTYKRKDHLKLHRQTHLKKEHFCSECGKGFQKEEQLLVHMNTHLKPYPVDAEDNAPQFHHVFSTDGDVYDQDSLLVPRMIPKDADRHHECPVCHRKFKRRQHLKVHSNVHAKQHPNIWCSLCNEGFLSNQEFEAHKCMLSTMESAEYDAEQPNVPPEAKKENKHPFNATQTNQEQDMNMNNSREHDIAAALSPQRVYVCKYCGKPFKRKDHYKIHLHVHTGVKSLFCPDCGKGFYRKDHLQKHSLVHAKAKPKPKPKKQLPALYPINRVLPKKQVKPEITIHAPSNTKLRVPLQIKVPYQVVMSMDNGEQRAVTYHPQEETQVVS